MNKLQKMFSNVSKLLKETYKKFPITIIIVYIITLLFLFEDSSFVEKIMDESFMEVLLISAIGTLFVESLFVDTKKRILGNVISVLIALGFRELMVAETDINDYWYKIFAAYVTTLPILTIYINFKKSELTLSEYALKVLSNFGKNLSIYLLANIGILVVLAVFIELILDGEDYDLYSKILILLLGGFYVPALIDTISNVKNEVGKLIKILITYVYTPVVGFLIAILYLYITKITLNGELLKDSIFYILAITFAIGMPCTVLLQNYKENKKLYSLSKLFVYSFILVIVLQILAMNIRVRDYGLTETRYIAYLFMVFEIIAVILMIKDDAKNIDKVILVLVGLVLIGTISPLNIQIVPVLSQTARIENMVSSAEEFDALSNEDKTDCKSAYVYVERSKKGFIEEKLDKKLINRIEKYVPEETNNWTGEYIHISVYEDIDDGLNVSGYNKVYEIYNGYSEKNDNKNYKEYVFESRNDTINVSVDVEKFIEEMVEAEQVDQEDDKFEEIRLLDTSDENVKIYLTSFYLYYELYSKEIESISFDGYFLVK